MNTNLIYFNFIFMKHNNFLSKKDSDMNYEQLLPDNIN